MSSPHDTDTATDLGPGEAEESGPDRRSLIKAAALVAVPVAGVGTVVAACSSSNSKMDKSGTAAAQGGSGGSGGGSGGNGGPLEVAAAEVPVGGGKVFTDAGVVVTQPTAGTFKAFSAVCTHQGCNVSSVVNNQIHCPCHGSIFSAADGSVIMGPAPSPLGAMTATVSGTNVEVTGAVG